MWLEEEPIFVPSSFVPFYSQKPLRGYPVNFHLFSFGFTSTYAGMPLVPIPFLEPQYLFFLLFCFVSGFAAEYLHSQCSWMMLRSIKFIEQRGSSKCLTWKHNEHIT